MEAAKATSAKKPYIYCASLAILFTLLLDTGAVAGWLTSTYYSFVQIADGNLVTIAIAKYDSRKSCEKGAKNLWIGARTTCPTCKLEESVCSPSLPPAFMDIYENKSRVFPYVDTGTTKLIYTGVPIDQGNLICDEVAAGMAKQLHRPVRCIRGSM